MNKKQRPIPFPRGSIQRTVRVSYLMNHHRLSYRDAMAQISEDNNRARNTPMKGERCGAITRRKTSCMCKALANGRCKLHGGLSTGPKTLEGKIKSTANLVLRTHVVNSC